LDFPHRARFHRVLDIFRNTRHTLFANLDLKLLKSIQAGSILVLCRIDVLFKGISSVIAEGLLGSREGNLCSH
jgi:hypothetical protein